MAELKRAYLQEANLFRIRIIINKQCTLDFLLCFFMLGPYLQPAYFEYVEYADVISTIYSMWRYLSLLITFFVVVQKLRKRHFLIDKAVIPVVLTIGYYIYYILVTFIENGSFTSVIFQAAFGTTVVVCFFCCICSETSGFLHCALLMFEILMYINLILLIIFPEGLYNQSLEAIYCLVGQKNTALRLLFPGLLFSILYTYYKKDRITIRVWLYAAGLFLTAVLLKSSSSMVAMGVTLICMIVLYRRNGVPKWFNLYTTFAASLLVFLIVVLLQSQSFYSDFVEQFLGKDLTFTGRTVMWTIAVKEIAEKPLFGYGYLGSDALKKIFTVGTMSFDSCHNFYLDILFRSGFVGFGIIVTLVIYTGKKMMHMKSEYKLISFLTLALLVYFISWNFEPFVDGSLYYVLATFVMISYLDSPGSLFSKKNIGGG